MMRVVRQAWDWITLYLPVVLMGVLAMATYWLVRSTPVAPPETGPAAIQTEPDYSMINFSVKSFDPQGKLKSEVSGKQARHFPPSDSLEIEQVHIRAYDPKGRLSVATARRALAKGDGTEVQLMGGAQVVRADAPATGSGKSQAALVFSGDYLHALLDQERVRSDQPVLLTRGDDRFTADSMDFDNRTGVLQLKGRVRGRLSPAGAG